MKRRWLAGLLVLLLALVLGGCQKKVESSSEAEESFSVIEKMHMQVKDEGIFYIDGPSEQMRFYDFHLAESIPICDRPNCEHNRSECSAYLPQGYMSGMGCYRGKLYYFDNMAKGLPVYQCDKNGSNRECLTELNADGKYSDLSVMLPVFFVEDEMIFGLQYSKILSEPVKREDGTLADQQNFWMLGKLDLEKGAFEIVKEAEAYDGYTKWVEVLDYVDGNIFYHIAEGTDREEHVYNLKEQTDERLFEDSETMVYPAGSVGSMGCEIYFSSDGHTYRIYALDAGTKESRLAAEKEIEEGMMLFGSMAGNELVYCVYEEDGTPEDAEEFGAVSMETGEDRALSKEEYEYAPTVAATRDWYVGTGSQGIFCIPRAAYEEKDWSKAQVIGFF